jgi:antitoxin (DNA-binding transcriptional repressor) of toxin-antitoxin stability system
MIRTANIRFLKDKLSAFLRDVQRGDVVLVTNRGRVIAEIRQPSLREHERASSAPDRWRRLIKEGTVQVGLPNAAEAYQPGEVHLSAGIVDEALDQSRGPR